MVLPELLGGEGRTTGTAAPKKAFDLTNYTQSNRQTKNMHDSTISFPRDKLHILPSTKYIQSTCIPSTDLKRKCY